MTAGRGIVHSEMPATDGVQKGLQLWINLPAKDKMCAPYEPNKQSYLNYNNPIIQRPKLALLLLTKAPPMAGPSHSTRSCRART
jgi:hypothetical protein